MADRTDRLTSYKVSNMLISLGVMLVIIVAIVFLTPRQNYDSVHQIDPTDVIRATQKVAPYHVFVPAGLPNDWKATSAYLTAPNHPDDPTVMHIGYVTPAKKYAALEESNENSQKFINLITVRGKIDGERTISGVVWEQRFQKERSVHSLVRVVGGLTVIVSGNATYDELAVLASSLA